MIVKFLQNFLGRETAMKEIEAGSVLELEHQAAIELIASGVVEEVKEKPEPKRRVHGKNPQ